MTRVKKKKQLKKRGWLNHDQSRPSAYVIDGMYFPGDPDGDEWGKKEYFSVDLSIRDCSQQVDLCFDKKNYSHKINQLRSALDAIEGFIEENS
jgi:hypothetical protein